MRWPQFKFLKELSVEPACFVYFFVYGVYTIAAQRLVLQKTCSPHQVPGIQDFCNDTALLGAAADINTVRNVIGEALPGLVVFVAGSWRDATGLSRPLMFYTFISEFMSSAVFLVGSIFWSMPIWIMSVTESTITGFGGGKQLVNLAAICIISNRTSAKNRTFRLAAFTAAQIGGFCVSNAVSGYLLTLLGYVNLFACIMGFLLLAIILGIIFIKEEQNKLQKGEKWLNISKFKVVFKNKPNRAVIWLMIVNCWLIYSTMCGEEIMLLYFLERAFGLTVTECGLYFSYLMVMNFLSTLGLSPLLIKILKFSDFSISTIGVVSIMIATIGIVFSKTVVLLCIFAAVDIMRYTVITAQRSTITKCVADDELGTHWSFVGVGESLVPMVTLPIYDIIFKSTLKTLLGSHYFASATLAFVAFINICIARKLFKSLPKEETVLEETRPAEIER